MQITQADDIYLGKSLGKKVARVAWCLVEEVVCSKQKKWTKVLIDNQSLEQLPKKVLFQTTSLQPDTKPYARAPDTVSSLFGD